MTYVHACAGLTVGHLVRRKSAIYFAHYSFYDIHSCDIFHRYMKRLWRRQDILITTVEEFTASRDVHRCCHRNIYALAMFLIPPMNSGSYADNIFQFHFIVPLHALTGNRSSCSSFCGSLNRPSYSMKEKVMFLFKRKLLCIFVLSSVEPLLRDRESKQSSHCQVCNRPKA